MAFICLSIGKKEVDGSNIEAVYTALLPRKFFVAPHGAAITVSHSEHSMRFSFVSLVLHA
jgi:hypothetical protein